ncbi:MgtC/SapB family protein [Halorubraceae archaeon YAN]|nr:MgtC/SapB family protein [Halorubraceae archaeon YAN]
MLFLSLQTETLFGFTLDGPIIRIALAAALGLFLGLEREWSAKPAGVRTFSLTALLGAVFTIVAQEFQFGESLLIIGGLLVVSLGVLIGVQGIVRGTDQSLSLTTSVSLLLAYGVGVLVAIGYVLAGVTVAVVSSTLLVLKRELHGFAGTLSRTELRSTIEFAILAFVVYPLLPVGEVEFLGVPFEPRIAWLMVVTVAGIGIANYTLIRTYGGKGIAVTGFLGGLASSAAVVGAMLDHITQNEAAVSYGVAAVLLANAAMATRNLVIAIAFTLSAGGVLLGAAIPLGVLIIGSFVIAVFIADWQAEVEMELESPFSLKNALAFGSVFLFILAGSTVAQAEFGAAGLFISALLSGLISSAGVTTSAVLLYRSETIGSDEAIITILLATAASILVKVGLAVYGPARFRNEVALWSAVLLLAAGIATAIAVFA